MVRALESFKAELTRAQIKIPTTIEKVSDLGREALKSHEDLSRRWTAKGEAAIDAEVCEKLEIELYNARLKWKMMKDFKTEATDADQKASAGLLEIAKVKKELSRVAQKRSELNGRSGEVEALSGLRLNRLNTMLVKQSLVLNVLGGVNVESVSVFAVFVNRLGGDLVSLFHVRIDGAYSNNLVDCLEVLTHVTGAGAISLSLWSDSEGEGEDGSSTSTGSRSGGNVLRHSGNRESRDRHWCTLSLIFCLLYYLFCRLVLVVSFLLRLRCSSTSPKIVDFQFLVVVGGVP